jgi:hypothetical protein
MPRTVRRLMTHLALLAIVLLATLPTVGRMLSTEAPAPQPVATPQAMHHMPGMAHDMAGMTHAGHAAMMHSMHHMPAGEPSLGDAKATSGEPVARHQHSGDQHSGHGEGDCDYCPLLHSLLAMPGVALLTTPEAALPAPQFRMLAAALPWHYPSGLGSRGPPHPL